MTTEHAQYGGNLVDPELGLAEFQFGGEKLERVADDLLEWTKRWDVILGASRDAVDFNLAPRDRRYNHYREDKGSRPSRSDLQRLYSHLPKFEARLAGLEIPEEPLRALQLEFLRDKVVAHKVFFERRYLNHSLEERDEGDFDRFIEETQGISPEAFSAKEIQDQLNEVVKAFKKRGYTSFDKEQIAKYRRERVVEEDNQIETEIRSYASVVIDSLSRFLGMDVKPRFSAKTVDKDKYWINWASGDRDGFLLQVNLHPRHRMKWTQGKILEMTIHEIGGHFAQMASWQRAIGRRELLPVLGMTSIHDPEQVTTEGIAQTLHLFVSEILEQFPEEIRDEARFEIEYTAFRSMVYNNVHILANSRGYTQEAIIAYVQKLLPSETREEIRKQIEERTQDVAMQTYLYSYGIGNYRHRQYARDLNEDGRRELLKLIFTQPITPDQEERFVTLLKKDPRYTAKAA